MFHGESVTGLNNHIASIRAVLFKENHYKALHLMINFPMFNTDNNDVHLGQVSRLRIFLVRYLDLAFHVDNTVGEDRMVYGRR